MAKYLGLKRAADVKPGMQIKSTRELVNGYVRVPSGTYGNIMSSVCRDGHIQVDFNPCACCGIAPRIGGLQWDDLELMTKTTNVEITSDDLPSPEAKKELIKRIKAMGETFYSMSQEDFYRWIDDLPQEEFFALIEIGTPAEQS